MKMQTALSDIIYVTDNAIYVEDNVGQVVSSGFSSFKKMKGTDCLPKH